MKNNTIEVIAQETYVDRSAWADQNGEWKDEPDKLHFVDKVTDMDCLVVRGPSGALCGYVAVDETHPAFKADYNRVEVECHGGLTYGDMCQGEGGHICHVPRLGKPDHVFWLGFDCAHSGDISPSYRSDFHSYDDRYRSISYVISQCQELARQLTERAPLRKPYDWEKENTESNVD